MEDFELFDLNYDFAFEHGLPGNPEELWLHTWKTCFLFPTYLN
jgi:hypothetical protein